LFFSFFVQLIPVSGQQVVDEGSYILDGHAAVGIHVGTIVTSGITGQEQVNEIGDIVNVDLAVTLTSPGSCSRLGYSPTYIACQSS
jgi:hypothetical protein